MRPHRDDRGAAAVEAALVICFIILPLTFGLIGYGYMLSFRQSLSQAAVEAARVAAVDIRYTTDSARIAAAEQAVSDAVGSYGLSCSGGVLQRDGAAVSGSSCSITPRVSCGVGQCATVIVSYPYRDASLLPTLPGLGIIYPETLRYETSVRAD